MHKLARIDTALKRVLEEEGRRQTWLAAKLDVDPSQVWGWVHGLHVPAEGTREDIARVLGRTTDELWPTNAKRAA